MKVLHERSFCVNETLSGSQTGMKGENHAYVFLVALERVIDSFDGLW